MNLFTKRNKLRHKKTKMIIRGAGGVGAEKAMATHSSVLAWKILGTAEPGGLLSMASHGVRHD